MTDHEYLEKLLEAHAVELDGPEVKAAREERAKIEVLVRETYPGAGFSFRYGGSFAKRTMVRNSYDLDLLIYFEKDETAAGETLEAIYSSVRKTLESTYQVTPKRSSLRLASKGSGGYTHVDVVPGRYVDDKKEDVFIHQAEGDKARLKTNPDLHIAHVRDSGLRRIIRVVKIWKKLARLEIPTFILELLVIKVLDGDDGQDHGVNFTTFLTEVAENLDTYKIVDPANSNNDLYSIFTEEKQTALKSAAQAALEAHAEGGFEAVFGEEFEEAGEGKQLESVTKSAGLHPYVQLHLEDGTHALAPPWPARLVGSAGVSCTVTREGRARTIRSDDAVQTGSRFRYRVSTSVAAPYEVYWQVVNTGPEARARNALRGTFFISTSRDSSDPHVNQETADFAGKHWVEAFIVKDGVLQARSERFYVNIWRGPQRRVPRINR